MYALITLALAAIIIFIFTYASDKKLIKNPELILKAMSVALCVMGIFRFYLSDSFVKNISDVVDPLQSFLRWGYHIGYAMIPMSVFFNSRLIRNITTCFSLPVTILTVIFFDDTMAYFTSAGAGGFYVDEWIRYVTYILELTLALSTIILMQIHNKHIIGMTNDNKLDDNKNSCIQNKKNLINFLVCEISAVFIALIIDCFIFFEYFSYDLLPIIFITVLTLLTVAIIVFRFVIFDVLKKSKNSDLSRYTKIIKTVKEVLATVCMLPLILIQMMPSYIIRPLLPDFKLTVGMFEELHLLWLFALIAEIIVLHCIFRKRSANDKYMLLVFLVLAQVMHTNSQMLIGFTFSRMPLQLCNIAAFFYLYMIITKNKNVFDFCYLANLVGAAIAMILTSFSSETLCFWNIHYIYEHSFVVMVPILGLSLGVFPRLEKSALKSMLKYFSAYFVIIFVLGTIINSLKSAEYGTVNHFYMFNPDVAVSYLPFVGFVKEVHWQFGDFEVYPILVLTIFVLFITLNVLFYFITRGLYKLVDFIKARTNKKEPALSAE